MSDKERLRIPVRLNHSARKFYLQERAGIYYVRFDVPDWIKKIDPTLPRTVFQSLDTNMLPAAKLKAREKIEAVFEKRFEDFERTRKQGPSYAPLCAVLAAYKPDPRVVKPEVAANNRRMLSLLVREATGLSGDELMMLTADVWADGALWQKWVNLRLARVANEDYVAQERAAITINAGLAQARSVLSPKVMHLYNACPNMRFPDLTSLRAVRRLKVDADVSYRPLPQSCIDAIEADASRLKADDPEVYKAYLLMSRLGLRNSEVMAARWGWIESGPDRRNAAMVIERRSDFVPKNRARRRLTIDSELLRELDNWRGLPEAWIIDAPNKTDRHKICHDRLNAWLRKFLPPREKGAYELRKHAASIIVSRPESEGGGLVAAARFLGDTISTAEKHYASYLREVRGISSAEISRLSAVA